MYDFWVRQHHLEERIRHVWANGLGTLRLGEYVVDVNIISLNAIFLATRIALQQAATAKVTNTNVPAPYAQIQSGMDQSVDAAIEIAVAAKRIGQVNMLKVHSTTLCAGVLAREAH